MQDIRGLSGACVAKNGFGGKPGLAHEAIRVRPRLSLRVVMVYNTDSTTGTEITNTTVRQSLEHTDMEKKREPKSLKQKILIFMILCWGVPIAVFFAFTTSSYRNGIVEKAENLMEAELMNVAAFASIRIEDAITLCQRPSYEKTWENAWKLYDGGMYTRSEYLQQVNSSLKGKFYFDERFDLYAYYCYGEEVPGCFSSRIGASYQSYVREIQPEFADIMESDSSYVYVRVKDNRIFIIRNLYTTTDYRRYGTLVVELNRDKVFRDVPQHIRENMIICIGNNEDVLDFADYTEDEDKQALGEELLAAYDRKVNRRIARNANRVYNGYFYQENSDHYHMGVGVFAERRELYSGIYEFYGIVAVMLVLFVPLFGYGIYFFKRHIQMPMDRMLDASQRIADGEIGATVQGGEMPNLEFWRLRRRFDSMSGEVKYLFDSVYNEKLARKDAQIQALQAQINPHFLNNTLEMMNWQARMSKDMVVSKMIEALGTVLDYRMNRADVREIHLAEELQCIDAYFYIMSMRFGHRLSIERDIDESLLPMMVPPLILQPIVENAIVHGVEAVKNGVIHLEIYHDEHSVYLLVRNTGKEMTEETKQRIRNILEGGEDQIPKEPGRHTSIGIQNVNRRIRLLYGEEYGLTIEQREGCETVSTIRLPYNEELL